MQQRARAPVRRRPRSPARRTAARSGIRSAGGTCTCARRRSRVGIAGGDLRPALRSRGERPVGVVEQRRAGRVLERVEREPGRVGASKKSRAARRAARRRARRPGPRPGARRPGRPPRRPRRRRRRPEGCRRRGSSPRSRASPGIDARDGSRAAAGDPQRAGAERDLRRPAADANDLGDRVGGGVDALHAILERDRHPHAAGAGRDAARARRRPRWWRRPRSSRVDARHRAVLVVGDPDGARAHRHAARRVAERDPRDGAPARRVEPRDAVAEGDPRPPPPSPPSAAARRAPPRSIR